MIVYYRISDRGYPKEKFDFVSKKDCLELFVKEFGKDKLLVIADNVIASSMDFIKDYNYELTNLGNAGSFNHVLNKAVHLDPEEIILFQEDDYVYLPGSKKCIEEGLEIADYVSLYDHPDKYIPGSKGGNPLVSDEGGEFTRVFLTESTHWKQTNSTTMTFAAKVKTLKEDKDRILRFTGGQHPHDFQMFTDLLKSGKKLITPIPTRSTHCETGLPAPLRNNVITKWEEVTKWL